MRVSIVARETKEIVLEMYFDRKIKLIDVSDKGSHKMSFIINYPFDVLSLFVCNISKPHYFVDITGTLIILRIVIETHELT